MIKVRLSGMTPGYTQIEPGTRLTIDSKWGKTRIWKDKGPVLLHCRIDNEGSIILIDQDTVEINGQQHKLVHPLKLNNANLYCIWINGTQPQS